MMEKKHVIQQKINTCLVSIALNLAIFIRERERSRHGMIWYVSDRIDSETYQKNKRHKMTKENRQFCFSLTNITGFSTIQTGQVSVLLYGTKVPL